MCFMIYLDINIKELKNRFNFQPRATYAQKSWQGNVLGPQKTNKIPVVFNDKNHISCEEMYWSLCPPWSKEFPCKWNTYNARLVREQKNKRTGAEFTQKIYDVPTFKNSFRAQNFCLVPITYAVESCYWGDVAGNIVKFGQESSETFYIAGLWDEWTNTSSGEVHRSVTLLTDRPYRYFFEHGHDRSIIAIDEQKFEQFLARNFKNPHESFNFIKDNRVSKNWAHKIERPLKDGWQKHIPSSSELEKIALSTF